MKSLSVKALVWGLPLLILAVVLTACSSGEQTVAPTQDLNPAYTQVAQTVEAQQTQVAPPPSEPLPTEPPPTEAPPPTAMPTATPTVEPSPTPAPEHAPITNALFEDDFTTDTGWITGMNDRYGYERIEGGYFMYVNVPFAQVHSVRSLEVADIRLATDAARIAGPVDGYFGVICRFTDANNYYALVIASDGAYGIAKMEAGTFSFIQEGLDEANIIQGGEAFNRVRGDCVGQTLVLYANDQKLLELQDATFEEGEIGLIAGTREEPGLRVLYDAFAIIE